MFSFYKVLVISVLCVFVSMSSCKQSKTENTNNATTTQQKTKKNTLPVPSTEFLTNIYNKVDYIDIVFDKTNFSVSVTDKPNAQRNVSYMTQSEVEDVNCTPYIGRMYFNSQGEPIATAQIHHSENCKYFIFTDASHRPRYACLMSEAGLAFYDKILTTQVAPMPK